MKLLEAPLGRSVTRDVLVFTGALLALGWLVWVTRGGFTGTFCGFLTVLAYIYCQVSIFYLARR